MSLERGVSTSAQSARAPSGLSDSGGFAVERKHASPPSRIGRRWSMARAYSQDLRARVIDAALAGMAARQAAVRFGVGIATAIVWVRRARETGGAHGAPAGPAATFEA